MEQLKVGRAKLTWLNGGVNFLDGGAAFGVVPRVLWTKKYPVNENNLVEYRTDPILLQVDGKNYLIDTGTGLNKLTEKQIRNFGVLEEAKIKESLMELNVKPEELDGILMTHMHYDHANGLTDKVDEDVYVSAFPNVPIYVSETEWNEMRNPNIRSRNSYWKMNWEPIQDQVQTFKEEMKINDYVKMIHTGGHSDGHAIIVFEDGDDMFIHMADLFPTHAHQNVLWVMAYDDYPITSIFQKEKWFAYGYKKKAWFTFYHDAYYRALKYDENGEIIDKVERKRYEYN